MKRQARLWKAYINKDGVRRELGYFKTEDEARAARLVAERDLFGDYAP